MIEDLDAKKLVGLEELFEEDTNLVFEEEFDGHDHDNFNNHDHC